MFPNFSIKEKASEEKEVDTADKPEEEEDEEGKTEEVEDEAEEEMKPRALHKTVSIFLRNLAPSITKQEVEAVSLTS